MNAEVLRKSLCQHFCTEVHVGEVPAGLALSLPTEDEIGDRIGAYLIQDRGAPYLADAGMFLAELEARGVDPLKGQRREFLDRVLRPAGAFVDESTLEIRTNPLSQEPGPDEIVRFLSALAAARGVQFWTREAVRSTFVEDATQALRLHLADRASVTNDGIVQPSLAEFPADLLIRPTAAGKVTAVFLVQAMDKLTEALLLWQEARYRAPGDLRVAALIEDTNTLPTNRRAQRAINRIDAVAYYREDEQAAVERIARAADLPIAA